MNAMGEPSEPMGGDLKYTEYVLVGLTVTRNLLSVTNTETCVSIALKS